MATITTDTFLDGGTARTAGEAWTCNGGILKVRTDTRWHANAPASMTGSLGSIADSASLGGGVLFDGRNVRWLPFNTGSGTVPAIGTTVSRSGASGYMLGVWANLTSAPTAVGAAMPATGFIKFREVTGGPFTAGALTGITATATGPDTTGWIEVVMDQAAAITVNRKGAGSVTRGDWFYLDNTTGSVGQVLQTPTNGGGAATFAPGVWIEDSPGSDEYSFWPGLNGATNGWSHQHIGQPTGSTDSRTEFVKSIGSGQMQIGEAFETASLAYAITNVTTATYTWAANVVTVALTAHGLIAGEQVYLDFTSGAATADGIYTIYEVTSANAFKVALTGSGTGGNVTYRARTTITYATQPFAVGNTFYVNVTSGSLVSGVYEAVATAAGTITINAPAPSTTAGNLTLRLTIGKIPPSGCKTRIPNVLLRQCATGTRAVNAAPNATLATRPDFTTTGAGVVDHEYTYGDWYYLTLQSYQTRLVNVATFDAISIAECASRLELINGGCGMHGALDIAALTLTSNFAGGQVTDWHNPRGNAPGTGDHAVTLTVCSGIDFLRGRSGIVQYARSSGFPVNVSQASDLSFTEHSCLNGPLSLATATNVDVISHDHVDRYIGVTNTGAVSAVAISAKSADVTIDGMTIGLQGTIPRVHPYTSLVSISTSDRVLVKNIGSRTSPLTTATNGINVIGSVWNSGGNNYDVKVKRCYVGRVRTGPSTTTNTDKNILEESVFGIYATTGLASAITPSALNNKVRGVGAGSNSVSANASVYGTHIYDIFTADTTGRVVCIFNEPTVDTATQVTYAAGNPKFTSVPSVSMPTVGDQIIVEMDYFAKGHTALANIAPTVTGTNTGNFTLTYQIDLGAGYNGTWLTLNGASLSGHTISPSTGFKIKFRATTATASTTNALTHIRIDTVSTLVAQTNNLYPISTVAASLQLLGLKANSEIRVFKTSDDAELAGIENSGTSFTYNYTWEGSDTNVYIVVHSLGYLPIRYEGVVLGSGGFTIPVQQQVDRQYSAVDPVDPPDPQIIWMENWESRSPGALTTLYPVTQVYGGPTITASGITGKSAETGPGASGFMLSVASMSHWSLDFKVKMSGTQTLSSHYIATVRDAANAYIGDVVLRMTEDQIWNRINFVATASGKSAWTYSEPGPVTMRIVLEWLDDQYIKTNLFLGANIDGTVADETIFYDYTMGGGDIVGKRVNNVRLGNDQSDGITQQFDDITLRDLTL